MPKLALLPRADIVVAKLALLPRADVVVAKLALLPRADVVVPKLALLYPYTRGDNSTRRLRVPDGYG